MSMCQAWSIIIFIAAKGCIVKEKWDLSGAGFM